MYDEADVSKFIYEKDGSIMLNILDTGNDEEFLFTYDTEMVFTEDTITWFEMEYQCGGDSCYDNSWGIDDVDPVLYIYDEDNNFIAIKATDTKFQISDGSAAWSYQHQCSQSLDSSGISLMNGICKRFT